MTRNRFWNALKSSLDWGARRAMWELFSVTFIFPILEAVLVNLWTGAVSGQAYVPGMTLLAVVVVHFVLGGLVLASQKNSPERAIAEAVEPTFRTSRAAYLRISVGALIQVSCRRPLSSSGAGGFDVATGSISW